MLHKDLVFIFNSYIDFKMTVKLENKVMHLKGSYTEKPKSSWSFDI